MTGTKYLSELVDSTALQKGKLNVIKAPTGSGKTYFALNYIPSLVEDAVHNVVYLIDTINGKDQIIRNYNAISEYYNWSKEVEEDGMWFDPNSHIVVLTYAKFGVIYTKYPDFYKKFSYIICDELHSLLKFQHFSPEPNYHSIARSVLELAVKQETGIVIALTATPDTIKKEFKAPSTEIFVDQKELIQYEVRETIGYTNLNTVLSGIDTNTVGLCYLSRITQMLMLERQAKAAGFAPVCIWSINNIDHQMSEEQLEVRRSILENWAIPPQYNLLIINSSSETSLKIKSPVDYVIVHSSNPDTQIQVRGRVNRDLQTLYLPTEDIPAISVPDRFIGKKLFTRDKQALIDELDLRDSKNNRRLGWHTIKSYLIDKGYRLTEGRSENLRYVIIEPTADDE